MRVSKKFGRTRTIRSAATLTKFRDEGMPAGVNAGLPFGASTVTPGAVALHERYAECVLKMSDSAADGRGVDP
jgi:hypothetical protein